MTLGAFGGVTGLFALYFFSDVPKVRKDILQVCVNWHVESLELDLMFHTEDSSSWKLLDQRDSGI
jgi:hypothetical protein